MYSTSHATPAPVLLTTLRGENNCTVRSTLNEISKSKCRRLPPFPGLPRSRERRFIRAFFLRALTLHVCCAPVGGADDCAKLLTLLRTHRPRQPRKRHRGRCYFIGTVVTSRRMVSYFSQLYVNELQPKPALRRIIGERQPPVSRRDLGVLHPPLSVINLP